MNIATTRFVIALVLGLVFAVTPPSRAAKAPVSQANLEKQAVLVVSGTVNGVTSKTEKSKVETGFGIHRDKVFRIKVKVAAVSKGSGVKAGDEIEVVAWKPAKRIPPVVGLQGHETIPKKGERVVVYVEGKDGKAFKPILPNGISIEKKKGTP
ncbi:MAG: hypothetical protein P8J87_08035 [Verrucomicrobiales bacterium]|nr:hypothetical protein [Verrucomicrobiales bacterium]